MASIQRRHLLPLLPYLRLRTSIRRTTLSFQTSRTLLANINNDTTYRQGNPIHSMAPHSKQFTSSCHHLSSVDPTPSIQTTTLSSTTKTTLLNEHTPLKQRNPLKIPNPECWISVQNTPHLSKLDDLLSGIQQTFDDMEDAGILLDEQSLPHNPHFPVTGARLRLSLRKRPTGWFLRFATNEIARSFLAFQDVKPTAYAGMTEKELSIRPFKREKDMPVWKEASKLRISPKLLRVENVPHAASSQDVRFLFRRYDVTNVMDVYQSLISPDAGRDKKNLHWQTNTFLVWCYDGENARAGLRETQNKYLLGNNVQVFGYPEQIGVEGV